MSRYLRHEPSGKVLLARNTQRPEFGHGGKGHSWDFSDVTIDGETYTGHLDTTWGQYLYVEWDGHWFKLSLSYDDRTFPFAVIIRDGHHDWPSNWDLIGQGSDEPLTRVAKADYDAFCDRVRQAAGVEAEP